VSAALSGDPVLCELLRREIRARGPLPFSRFQSVALYDAERGYYSRGAGIGRAGADFLTAAETTPEFGALIGVQIEEMHARLGAPAEFAVVEYGPGEAGLMAGMLAAWRARGSPLYRSGACRLVEPSPVLAGRQRLRLAEHGPVVTWPVPDEAGPTATTGDAAPAGVLIMNEVLDALPVDRVRQGDGGLEEIRVGLDGERFIEVCVPAPAELRDELEACLRPDGCALEPEQDAEVRTGLTPFLAAAGCRIGAGYLLVIDYALEPRALYAPWRAQGTLLAYHRHRATSSVLERVGEQDLTAHVDLGALRRAAAAAGFEEAGQVSQMSFLLALGLADRIEALEAESGLSEVERLRRRLDLTALIRPGGMGDLFRVWIGARRAAGALRGLRSPRPA